MLKVFYALVPVIAWGTWLAPSQNIRFPNQHVKTFYVTAANLGLTLFVVVTQGFDAFLSLPLASFWMVFGGGIIWALSGFCAFSATAQIGMARAFGIWAPLNIIVSMLWGALLFNEFPYTDTFSLLALATALTIIIIGVLLIIFSKNNIAPDQGVKRRSWIGYAAAVGAGVLWGSYFIPIQYAEVSMWVGAFPLALGMFSTSALMVLITGQSPRLEKVNHTLRTLLTGLIWGIGNYGMLLLVNELGAGRGFTIAQLSVVVNALVGIYWLKDPQPGSRAAWMTFIGCVLATLGGIVLGNLK